LGINIGSEGQEEEGGTTMIEEEYLHETMRVLEQIDKVENREGKPYHLHYC